MTREHAMLLSFAGAAILFLTLSAHTKRIAFNWGDSSGATLLIETKQKSMPRFRKQPTRRSRTATEQS